MLIMLDLHQLLETLIHLVEFLGYTGLFIMTFIESTFIPIPSEITLIPAGYLAHAGEMDFIVVLIVSVVGTIAGSLFNYYLAKTLGRKFLVQYGKYMFMKPETLGKIDTFFANHGAISLFTGRLLPGIKHFISFPAGLAKVPLSTFIFFTGLGALVWCWCLIYLGYLLGENSQMVSFYLKQIKIYLLIFVLALVLVYIVYKKKRAGAI